MQMRADRVLPLSKRGPVVPDKSSESASTSATCTAFPSRSARPEMLPRPAKVRKARLYSNPIGRKLVIGRLIEAGFILPRDRRHICIAESRRRLG
jgi:hypothetical protein